MAREQAIFEFVTGDSAPSYLVELVLRSAIFDAHTALFLPVRRLKGGRDFLRNYRKNIPFQNNMGRVYDGSDTDRDRFFGRLPSMRRTPTRKRGGAVWVGNP